MLQDMDNGDVKQEDCSVASDHVQAVEKNGDTGDVNGDVKDVGVNDVKVEQDTAPLIQRKTSDSKPTIAYKQASNKQTNRQPQTPTHTGLSINKPESLQCMARDMHDSR
jgi:hypothetical protein